MKAGTLGEDRLKPDEIKDFMKHHEISRVTVPDDPSEYGRRWIAWWRALQPAWRLPTKDGEPFKTDQNLPDRPVWTNLSVAGQDGIVLALVGLVIWRASVDRLRSTRGEGNEVKKYFRDVDLVLQMMTANWRKSPLKKRKTA